MKKRNYWDILKQDILQNKLLFFWVILTAVLCFGFTITNFSIGVDDSARNYYLYGANYGNMIQQGRLMHVVFNLLTRTVQFIPFFTDFIGAALYALSALLFCALFQYITDSKFSSLALISFSCVYISSSIIAEKYIYHLDVIVTILSYSFSVLALLYAYRFVKEKKILLFWKATVFLMGALASYESFGFLYFCGVFAIFILEIAINGENKSFLTIMQEGIKYALILCAAMLLYYGLVYLTQFLTGQYGVYVRYNYWKESGLEILGAFLKLTEDFRNFFTESIRNRYLPILVFVMCSLVGAALSILLSVRRKNIWLLFCFAALWLGNFLIHYTAGSFMTRAAQTFCFFDGFVLLMLIASGEKCKFSKRMLAVAIVWLVFVQSADMNRWFYNDYVRYKKEVFVIDTIATELVGGYDISKPVVFSNKPEIDYLTTALYSGRQVNGNSMIYWSTDAWSDKTQPFVTEIFRMHGYDFVLSPTEEQYDQAMIEAKTMPQWPQEGCIQEFDDFIVVNFG